MPVCFSDYDLLGNQLSATDGSGALMSKYYNRNFKEYIWNRNIYYYYTDKIKEIEKREKEINDELKWQGMVNRGAYKEIDQKNFNNIPLFNGTVAKTGCGIVAAVNLASMSGVDVDVDEALKYFNQPENRYNKAGAVRPSAITAYLYTKGLQTEILVAGVSIASLFQVAGRFIISSISDKISSKNSMILVFIITILSVIILTVSKGYVYIVCFWLLSFAYGGSAATIPSLTTDYFGVKNAGVIVSLVLIGMGVSSICTPLIAKAVGENTSFIIAAVAAVIGIVLVFSLPKKKK